MKTALFVVILTFAATSVLARPPSFDSEEEYTDNNLSDSIPDDGDHEDDDERTDYIQM